MSGFRFSLRRAVSLLGAIAGTVSAFQPASGQEEPPQTFRADANLVYVDAYPRQGGRLVEGLSARDFQVLEDGAPQAIETFEFIRFDASPPDAVRRDPRSVADSERQASDPRSRVFVIYLDMFHTTRNGARDSRQPLVDFLHRVIGASDLFAVATPEMPTSGLTFVRRTDTIAAELSEYWDWGQRDQMLSPRTAAERHLIDCAMLAYAGDPKRVDAIHRRFREKLTYDTLDAILRRLRDVRDERTNLLLVSEGWQPEPARDDLAQFSSGTPPLPTIGVGRGGRLVRGDPQNLHPDAAGCRAEVAELATINFIERFRDLVGAAERANVTFYPVDVGGLHGNLRTTETLRTLAGATDGYAAVNSNDLGGGLRGIADRLTSYYLLGYYSTNTSEDGRFRRIEVKVTRPGVSVAARRGYLATSSASIAALRADAAATAPPSAREDVTAALGELARLRSEQALYTRAAFRSGAIEVVADLADEAVESGRWSTGGAVDVTVSDAAGATTTGRGVIDAGGRAALVRVPLSDERGPWQVHVRVSDEQGAVESRTEVPLRAGGIGAPMVFRGAGPARRPMQPVAQLAFRRNERIRVQWMPAGAVDAAGARLLDRRGQPLDAILPVTAGDAPDGGLLARIEFPLGSLATGDYVIELTAGLETDAERYLVPFRVR